MKEYKQTTLYTSGIACLLMVLNHFKPKEFELSRENEFKLWQRTATLPTRGACVFAMALVAAEQEIPCNVVVGDPEYKFPFYRFDRLRKSEVEDANFITQIFRKHAEDKGVKTEVRDFDLKEIKKILGKGKKVVTRLNYGFLAGKRRPRINYYLLDSYKDKKFLVYDPFEGKRFIEEETLKEAFEGVVTKCKRDHRMVVFG
jgi:hypothetical protein